MRNKPLTAQVLLNLFLINTSTATSSPAISVDSTIFVIKMAGANSHGIERVIRCVRKGHALPAAGPSKIGAMESALLGIEDNRHAKIAVQNLLQNMRGDKNQSVAFRTLPRPSVVYAAVVQAERRVCVATCFLSIGRIASKLARSRVRNNPGIPVSVYDARQQTPFLYTG